MKSLKSFFGNLFSTGERPSEIGFKSFAEDHIVRIALYNNAGQYDQMLNDTQARFTSFFGEITDENVNLALRKSRTRSVDIFIAKFKKEITHVHNVIAVAFDDEMPEYLEFFPRGLTEYGKATKSNIDILLKRLKVSITTHSSSFSVPFVASVSGYLDQYNVARGAQLTQKDKVSGYIISTAQAREDLENELTKNIHALALEYVLTPQKGLAFFNQSLLHIHKYHPQTGESGGEYVLAIPFGQNIRADFTLRNDPAFTLLIANTGTVTFFVYSAPDKTGMPIPAIYTEVKAGEEKVFSALQLGASVNPYLFFFIKEPDSEGEATISEVDKPEL